ncbi:MAG: hypothetical protein M1813_000767 [Trichoglossum hirsutum]|nr:MAG: hypothetical protein M1813_000767 [Trichoglossum hirsutum]
MAAVELHAVDNPTADTENAVVVVAEAQHWNRPRANVYRVVAACYSFVVLGLNDAAYGISPYYNLTYTLTSLLFLPPSIGYFLAAPLNNKVHLRLGLRGIAFVGPLCQIVCYVVFSFHPPYPVLLAVFVVAGFGNGLQDAAWNAWVGSMSGRPNELLGILHGCYGLGAAISPTVATVVVVRGGGKKWYVFYYIMTAAAVLGLVVSLAAFWPETGKKFRDDHPRTSGGSGGRTKEALSNKITWICSLYLLTYVGTEVALGGWIVTFMIHVRHGTPFASGISSTGFWLGIAVGRVVLGFITSKFGERLSITAYLLCAMGLELLFWLVPQFVVSAVAVAFLGFVMGPLFPGAIVGSDAVLLLERRALEC